MIKETFLTQIRNTKSLEIDKSFNRSLIKHLSNRGLEIGADRKIRNIIKKIMIHRVSMMNKKTRTKQIKKNKFNKLVIRTKANHKIITQTYSLKHSSMLLK